jgi:hypothetical protein
MAEPPELPQQQQRALDTLKPLSDQFGLYLAGGTALAFHLKHRASRDLDLFSLSSDLDLEQVRVRASTLTTIDVVSVTDAALQFRMQGVPVDVVRYPYPLLNRTVAGPRGVATASIEDLATMKLAAATRRGIRRDFWDLHEIFERGGLTLESALHSYVRRYGVQQSDVYHVLRALGHFEDAERETLMPQGLTLEKWRSVKAAMSERAARALGSLVERHP